MPRFLADESCDYAVVRALTSRGHEVLLVAELSPRADDEQVIGLALREERVLLTEDKDFGQLVHAAGFPSVGVVLLRFPTGARSEDRRNGGRFREPERRGTAGTFRRDPARKDSNERPLRRLAPRMRHRLRVA